MNIIYIYVYIYIYIYTYSKIILLYFLSLLSFCPYGFSKNWFPLLYNFPNLPNFHSPPSKKSKREVGVGTMCIHLKIYEIIFISFCVFLLKIPKTFWCFLNIFLLFSMFDMVFCNDFRTFLEPNQTQSRFYHPIKNKKPMEFLQTKTFYRAAQFLGSQNIWVVYAH